MWNSATTLMMRVDALRGRRIVVDGLWCPARAPARIRIEPNGPIPTERGRGRRLPGGASADGDWGHPFHTPDALNHCHAPSTKCQPTAITPFGYR